jgi:hypothetical protein
VASKPWADHELKLLERHVDDRQWLVKVAPKLPYRSVASLRGRMQLVRIETGTGHSHSNGSEWMRDAADATRRLLEATLRVGVWS